MFPRNSVVYTKNNARSESGESLPADALGTIRKTEAARALVNFGAFGVHWIALEDLRARIDPDDAFYLIIDSAPGYTADSVYLVHGKRAAIAALKDEKRRAQECGLAPHEDGYPVFSGNAARDLRYDYAPRGASSYYIPRYVMASYISAQECARIIGAPLSSFDSTDALTEAYNALLY